MNKASTFSMIGADVFIEGNLSATADLHIDGQVRGDITCTSLVQGPSSELTGLVSAQSGHLAGTVRGTITISTLVIQRSAHIIGDVHYESLTIEQGARVEGRFAKAGSDVPMPMPVPVDDHPLMLESD